MAVKYVNRHGPFDRVCHWVAAISFSILAISGLGLFEPHLLPVMKLLGGAENAILTHKYVGIVFGISGALMILAHLKDTLVFDKDDVAWIKVMGGYRSRDAEEPPMGKYNTGQKIFSLFTLVALVGFIATGYLLWSPLEIAPETMSGAIMIHSLLFVLIGAMMIIHIYLGTVGNPGTLDGILYGEVSESWAKKHSPKWLAKIKSR